MHRQGHCLSFSSLPSPLRDPDSTSAPLDPEPPDGSTRDLGAPLRWRCSLGTNELGVDVLVGTPEPVSERPKDQRIGRRHPDWARERAVPFALNLGKPSRVLGSRVLETISGGSEGGSMFA